MGNIFMNHEEAEHLEKRIGHSVEIEGCIGYLVKVESYGCENKDSDRICNYESLYNYVGTDQASR